MDEDLKIVLTSELEADEEASAQRISAQLPNIAKLINSKSSIKVGVTLDEAGIQSQTQRITQQIARATKSQSVGVSLSLDQSSVNKIKTELNNLKVSPDISRAMTDQLDQMGIQIDRITGRWEAVNGEEERMLNLTIQGTDQMQRTVTYLQTYNAETGEINTHLTNVTANLERQRREQEQVAAQAKKDNESRVSYLNRQKALLADIQAAYVGQTSVKPITDSAHLTALNDTYAAVNARIETMIAAEGRLDNVQRSNLEAQISGLQRLVKEYQNAEYVATKLRTKDIGSIKADQLSGLEALEKRLESAGTLTDTFKSKIDGLKKTLQGVGTKDQLVAFLNSFDQLNNDVAVFQERLRGANKIYTQLISLDKQIIAQCREDMHRWLGPGKKIREYVCRSDEKAADIELNAFAGDNERNAIRLLYCVDMLNEGIHIKDVDGVVMLRPTISPIVYLQQIGRCLACSSDGSTSPVIFDLVNNYESARVEESGQRVFNIEFSHHPSSGKGKNTPIPFYMSGVPTQFEAILEKFDHLFTRAGRWDFCYSILQEFYHEYGQYPHIRMWS